MIAYTMSFWPGKARPENFRTEMALLNPGNGAQFPGALASRRRVPVFGSRLAGATGGRSQAVHREFENKFAFAKKSGY
jgi:hypothetical protein